MSKTPSPFEVYRAAFCEPTSSTRLAPAQAQLDALREEVARLKESRDDLHNALHGERDRTDAYVSKLHAELAALKAQPTDVDEVMALQRLERAVDWHLGRSGFTQSENLKGLEHSANVRKELYAAHDAAREALRAKLAARKEPT